MRVIQADRRTHLIPGPIEDQVSMLHKDSLLPPKITHLSINSKRMEIKGAILRSDLKLRVTGNFGSKLPL